MPGALVGVGQGRHQQIPRSATGWRRASGWGGVAEALWESPTGAEQGVGSSPAVGRAGRLLHTCGAPSFRTSLMF